MTLRRFHPAVAAWFHDTFRTPTDCQQRAWAAIREGRDALVAAPTGSGKTLAAFLNAIDELAREGEAFGLPEETRVVYVSPLKALSNDIQKNLEEPLAEINRRLFEQGCLGMALRSQVRTGDTPQILRAAMLKHPPHILVTTPESLYILLTSEGGRRLLGTARTVIVDEIHAVVGSKRGAHLALSLERLDRLAGRRLRRIGLSATQKPIEQVAAFLTGSAEECVIIDGGHRRRLDLAIELPDSPLEAVLSQEAAGEIHARMAELIRAHRTTLVFVNTRRMAERLARALSERLGEQRVTSHHGSLSREQRLAAEERLKSGQLKVLVATASLELGIDIGDVDLVCQLGTTGSIAAFLQRVGRSGHSTTGIPKGRLFPTSRDDLVECLALLRAVRAGELDMLAIPEKPLDVLAQQIVALVSAEDWSEDDLYRLIVRAFPYRALSRAEFDAVIRMLAEGYSTRRGPRGAYLHRDGIHRRLRARRGARLTAVTCGGAIPDNAEYRVVLEPAGDFLGTVDEDFAIESMRGDIFQLGNASWRVLRLEGNLMRVEDAHGQPPTIPFWFGEAPGRSYELSTAVSRLRQELSEHLEADGRGGALDWLAREEGVPRLAAEQAVNYLGAAKTVLGVLPNFDTVVFERFFDESGGMQFIIHAPFGSRVNRAWGLALRKRFCRTFNFELQAAANENALLLSLGTVQSFALEDVKAYLAPETVREVLIQALLTAPMFTVRWRWNAVCSLALRRFQGGKKTPPYLLRMQAEDLVTSVFPEQMACLENIVGDREIPDHPLVNQTLADCLHEAMDLARLIEIVTRVRSGAIEVVCRDLSEPSPLAAEIVNARVYSFLDDAPLEERRTRAVVMRRWLDPAEADDLGRLDAAAIERVRQETAPEAESAEELHDALQVAGFIPETAELPERWPAWLRELGREGRAARLSLDGAPLWFAAERWPQFRALYPGRSPEPVLRLPPEFDLPWTAEDALTEILRARLGVSGPVRIGLLAARLGLPPEQVRFGLARLEGEGFALRGRYTPGAGEEEWCERRLLARIHRHTLERLRREVEPVASADFVGFLLRWQHLHPETRWQGSQALAAVAAQLEGFEAPALAWESELLPVRIQGYDPAWLDQLCRTGKTLWMRLTPPKGGPAPGKSMPIALLGRRRVAAWSQTVTGMGDAYLSGAAQRVFQALSEGGAQFHEELLDRTGLLKTLLERGLAELVGKGLATADGFSGLRSLLVPESRKRRYRGHDFGLEEAGRWSLIRPPQTDSGPNARPGEDLEHVARCLLQRYGVMFRALLAREGAAPPWQTLLPMYRRMEARGEIRGGRFVAGQYGEQFALPDAVQGLRTARRNCDDAEIAVSAADPLNLVGIVTPGPRVAALAGHRILYRGGRPIAVSDGAGVKLLADLPEEPIGELRERLIRPPLPPRLRAYLGRGR